MAYVAEEDPESHCACSLRRQRLRTIPVSAREARNNFTGDCTYVQIMWVKRLVTDGKRSWLATTNMDACPYLRPMSSLAGIFTIGIGDTTRIRPGAKSMDG